MLRRRTLSVLGRCAGSRVGRLGESGASRSFQRISKDLTEVRRFYINVGRSVCSGNMLCGLTNPCFLGGCSGLGPVVIGGRMNFSRHFCSGFRGIMARLGGHGGG